jgi:hypothetical protein
MGELSLRRKDFAQAAINAQKSLELAEKFGDVKQYCISNRGLGMLELYKCNFNKSKEYIIEALEVAQEYEISARSR